MAGSRYQTIDVDTQKWFNVQSLPNLTSFDLYLTMGNTSAQTPLRLNGQGFSIKLGVLVNTSSTTQDMAGTAGQNRIVKRIRPA
jgi:hypothetical protein